MLRFSTPTEIHPLALERHCGSCCRSRKQRLTYPSITMIGTILGAACLGILTWSFLEYVIHRFAAHSRSFWRSSPFSREHTRHHAEGNYFAPAWKKVPVAIVFMLIIAPMAIALTNQFAGLSYATALVGTYVAYEVHHRRLHTHAGNSTYGRWARLHHFHHHFVDPRTNHGVTSPLWDFVFGTYRRPSTIRVPERLCMAWLIDPNTRNIAESYSNVFVVIPSR